MQSPRPSCCWLTSGVLLFTLFMVSRSLAAPTTPVLPLSQVDIEATLSIAEIRRVLRDAAAGAGIRPRPFRKTGAAGVGVTGTATPRFAAMGLTPGRNGTLILTLPIDVTVSPVRPGATVHAVDVTGCRPTTFALQLPFVPEISTEGQLAFSLGQVTADNPGYVCRMKTNAIGDVGSALKQRGLLGAVGDVFSGKGIPKAADVDVADQLRAGIVEVGADLAGAKLTQINALLPDDAQLRRLIERPAVFGGAVTLGIDRPALRVRRVAAEGDAYRVTGVLRGRPRLLFADAWDPAQPQPGDGPAADGFRLPATLLLPTDRDLLPDAAASAASGWLGDFRLRSVPDKPDLAVLQRRDRDGARNLVWLSGGQHGQVPEKVRTWDRPMSDLLRQILDWLKDQAHIAGVNELIAEVERFDGLLDGFQAATRIPLDERGSLYFHDLRVDLGRLWVTNEAILADVVLHGRARLDMRVGL